MEDRFEKIKHRIQIKKETARKLEESYSRLEDYIRFSEAKGDSIEIIKFDSFSGDEIERLKLVSEEIELVFYINRYLKNEVIDSMKYLEKILNMEE